MARWTPPKKAEPVAEVEEEEDTTVAEEEENGVPELTVYECLLQCAEAVDAEFVGQGEKEGDQTFFKRLITVISDSSEDEGNPFDEMPEEAQDWFNSSGELMVEGKEISAPEGFVSNTAVVKNTKKGKTAKEPETKPAKKTTAKKAAPEPEPEPDPEPEEEPKKAVKKATKPPAKKAAPEPEAKGGKVKKKPPGRQGTATKDTMRLFLKNPGLSAEALKDAAVKSGIAGARVSTCAIIRYNALNVITIAKELGLWSKSA